MVAAKSKRRTLAHARKRVQREIGSGSNIDAIGGAQCGGALNARPKSVAANGMLARHATEMSKEHSAGAIAS